VENIIRMVYEANLRLPGFAALTRAVRRWQHLKRFINKRIRKEGCLVDRWVASADASFV
jgi:hypothetical protein